MLRKWFLIISFTFAFTSLLDAQTKFIFTGGPCCGKTTVLKKLQEMGHQVCPEAYSALHKEARANGTLNKFSTDMIYQRYLIMQRHLEQESRLDPARPAFLDRSIPDVIFYGNYFNVAMPADLIQIFEHHKIDYRYVFIFEPVPKILYQQTESRQETCAEAAQMHQAVLKWYAERDFRIIHVPFDTVEKRIKFILDQAMCTPPAYDLK